MYVGGARSTKESTIGIVMEQERLEARNAGNSGSGLLCSCQ